MIGTVLSQNENKTYEVRYGYMFSTCFNTFVVPVEFRQELRT